VVEEDQQALVYAFGKTLYRYPHYYHSGKTLLARTLAKVLDVPFSISDATSFTQVRGPRLIRKHSLSFRYRQDVSHILFTNSRTLLSLCRPDVGEDVDMAVQRLVSDDL
jgi:hypothetical protein